MSKSLPAKSFTDQIDKHLATCAAVVGAAVVGGVTAHSNAAIQYSGLINITSPNSNFGSVFINAGSLQASTSPIPGYNFQIYARTPLPGASNTNTGSKGLYLYATASRRTQDGVVGFGRTGANPPAVPNAFYVSKLGSNTLVSSANTFVNYFNDGGFGNSPIFAYGISGGVNKYPNAQWNGGATNGYVGFKFVTGGQTDYGWIRMNVSAYDPASQFQSTVVEFAYEDSGAAILTGATGVVPEPTSAIALGLLALGAAGIRPMRNGRNAVA